MEQATLIFGGGNIGSRFASVDTVEELLDTLASHGVHRIDTAANYPPGAAGGSEDLLGKAHAAKRGFIIDTKIKCNADGKGSLTAAAIEESVTQSLLRLRVTKVNVLYCHRTDPDTPLAETASALNEQFQKGRFNQLGVANFPPSALSSLLSICAQHNYIAPTVYQGQYNVLYREYEEEIFPTLREHNMAYTAFSPLAGSLLTNPSQSNTRPGTSLLYTRENSILEAVNHLANSISRLATPVSLPNAALRWLGYHSHLGVQHGDGIVLGASNIEQLEQNLASMAEGRLSDEIVAMMEGLWIDVRPTIIESRRRAARTAPTGAKNISLQVWREV